MESEFSVGPYVDRATIGFHVIHFLSLEWFTDVAGFRVVHFLPLDFRAIHFFFIAGLYVIHRYGSLFIAEGSL